MQNKLLTCGALFGVLCFSVQLSAQVRGISYTLMPVVEYSFWDEQSGLDNNLLIGGKVGFGFGEYFELRGIYQQSLGLETNFDDFDFGDGIDIEAGTFDPQEVDYKRYGGEIKANIGRGQFLPYVVLGAGIQELRLDASDETNEQIYLTGGLGINLTLADRFSILLEGRNTGFRYASGASLLTDDDLTILDLDREDFDFEDVGTWSVAAGVQVYLGGRRPGEMSDLDQAYFNSLRGGDGVGIQLEGLVGTINWDDNSAYRDAPLWGAMAGLELGPYVGLRGFYWRAATEGELFDFDDLQMFGGEMRLKLAQARGITPYLLLGGGAIDVKSDYVGRTVNEGTPDEFTREAEDAGFAMGGAGLMLPLGKKFKLFGSARALLTSNEDLENVDVPSEVRTNWMYSAGFKINFGRSARDPEVIVENQVDAALSEQRKANKERISELRRKYEMELDSLEEQLADAYEMNDTLRVDSIRMRRLERQSVVNRMRADEQDMTRATVATQRPTEMSVESDRMNTTNTMNTSGQIRMSAAEFANLLEEVLESVEPRGYYPPPPGYGQQMPPNYGYPGYGNQDNRQGLTPQERAALEREFSRMQNTVDELSRRLSERDNQVMDLRRQLDELKRRVELAPTVPTPTVPTPPQNSGNNGQ